MTRNFTTTTVQHCLLIASVGLFAACSDSDDAPTGTSWAAETEANATVAPSSGESPGANTASTTGRATASSTSNSAPEIRGVRFEPAKPVSGDTLRAVVETYDADGDTPFLDYEWQVGSKTIANGVPKLMLLGVARGNPVQLTVTARDGKSESEPYLASTRVHNAAPAFNKVDIEPAGQVVAGQKIVLRADARDADGDDVEFTYSWTVNGRKARETGSVLDTADLKRGDEVQALVMAYDGEDHSEPFETPLLKVVNTPPLITSWPGAPTSDGDFLYQIQAEDPDGNTRLMYELAEGPEGMKVDAQTGEVRWTPTPSQMGKYNVALVVDDQQGGKTKQIFEVSTGAASPAAPAESGE